MEKYLLDPKAPEAFSSDVMHKVVLNGIDFELPDNIWDAIAGMLKLVMAVGRISILQSDLSLIGCKRNILSFHWIRLQLS